MRSLRVVLTSLLLLSPLSCARSTQEQASAQPSPAVVKAQPPGMPEPLPLPDRPSAHLHVDNPEALLFVARQLSGDSRSNSQVLADAAAQTQQPLESQLGAYVDLQERWDAVMLGKEPIIYLPIQRQSLSAVQKILDEYPKEGPFGAVRLRPSGERYPQLAYLNHKTKTLTLANNLRGIATGPMLAPRYRSPAVSISLTAATASRFGVQIPVERLDITGPNANELDIVAHNLKEQLPAEAQLTNGALTGLLSPLVTVGASSKYSAYRADVDKFNRDIAREVSRQNFLIRGTLEDLHRRFRAMAGAWNGRTMVGIGPTQHLLVGLGVNDPKRASNATLHFLSGVLNNLSTARMIGVSVPNVRLKRNSSQSAGTSIHVLTVPGAKGIVPRELHPLVDNRNTLHVAFAFSERAGSVMLAAGPQAPKTLAQWLQETEQAASAESTVADWAAARSSVPPTQLSTLIERPTALFTLQPSTTPTQVVIRRSGPKTVVELRRTL